MEIQSFFLKLVISDSKEPCGKIAWRWPAPGQTVWFSVMPLTIRPGLGQVRTVTFLYDQPLVSGWLATSHRLLSLKPDMSHTRTSRRAGLDIARPGPYQTIDCHEIFPHAIQAFLSWNADQRQIGPRPEHCQICARSDGRLPWNFSTWDTNFFVMECWPAPDLFQSRISKLDGLDIARSMPDQTVDCHGIFLHGIQNFLSWNADQRQICVRPDHPD